MFWIRPLSGEAGNGVDRFNRFLVADDTLTRDAADLRGTGPKRAQISGQRRGRFQPAGLDPAMAFLNRFGGLTSALTETDPLVLMETDPVIAHGFVIDTRNLPSLHRL